MDRVFACGWDISQGSAMTPLLPMQTKYISVILIWSIITATIIIGFGKLAHNLVERELKIEVKDSLNSTLVTNITALKSWIQEKKYDAKELANRPHIAKNIHSVLTQAQKQSAIWENKKLNDSGPPNPQEVDPKELQWLKKNLLHDGNNYGFTGFLIHDKQGNILITNSAFPMENQSYPAGYLQKSLSGKTFITKPFLSKILLKDKNGIEQKTRPMMWVSTPILNPDGNVSGSLVFSIRPEKEFSQIINIAKAGFTGKTYAVDQNGILLLETRHSHEKKNAERSRMTATVMTQLKNTESGLPGEKDKSIFKNINPLTQMATNLVQSEAGVNVSGYKDYRGVLVTRR